jgi:hypothetical protein
MVGTMGLPCDRDGYDLRAKQCSQCGSRACPKRDHCKAQMLEHWQRDPAKRIGSWMQLASGRKFWPVDPRADEVFIEDIAAALSKMCRYGGHCKRFYSVAEHCVLMAHAAPEELALHCLLHDAQEAYLSDVIRPIKSQLHGYGAMETAVESVIAQRFNLPHPMPAGVKWFDNAILADERAQNMEPMPDVPNAEWGAPHAPLGVRLAFWTPEKAEFEFLAAFRRYGGHWS